MAAAERPFPLRGARVSVRHHLTVPSSEGGTERLLVGQTYTVVSSTDGVAMLDNGTVITAPMLNDSRWEIIPPAAGTRVRLTAPVDRYPHFVAPEGATGEVIEDSYELYSVRLDDHLPGAEEWDNEVCWDLDAEQGHPVPVEAI